MKSPEPTVAAVVRQQTGVPWSRARGLCAEGRVTVDGQRCLDPATRVSPGMVVAVEVKAAETVRPDDFRGIRLLKRRLGARFRAGFVLYCGADSLSFGEGLTCLPISAVWTTPAN